VASQEGPHRPGLRAGNRDHAGAAEALPPLLHADDEQRLPAFLPPTTQPRILATDTGPVDLDRPVETVAARAYADRAQPAQHRPGGLVGADLQYRGPGANPRHRDSLLSTSDSLRKLVDEVDGWVTRFQLQPWKRESIATFARLRLTKEHDRRMMSWVDREPQVLTLCGTPYYAELVADRVKGDNVGLAVVDLPETELVRDAFRAILEREYGKDLIHFSSEIGAYIVLVGDLDPAEQDVVYGQNAERTDLGHH
jgi:hypothetical protein